MTTTPQRQRMEVNERALSSGTTARFIQMIVLMILASGTMAASMLTPIDNDHAFCLLAAGVDLDSSLSIRTGLTSVQIPAYNACVGEHVSSLPVWPGPAWTLLMTAAAAVLFWLLPRWRTRRSKVAVCSMQDQRVRPAIERLAARVGVHQPLKIVVDTLAPTVDATTFGRNGKPVIRLNGGLIKQMEKDPKRFEAVVLHELAHIRNRDITITYMSVVLWRLFLVFAAIPYLAYQLIILLADALTVQDNLFSETVQNVRAQGLLLNLQAQGLAVLLVLLTYLARLEVLRSRELYADRLAGHWDADPSGWEEKEPTRRRWIAALFSPLRQTHPNSLARRKVLADSEQLFTISYVQFLFTGAAAILIADQISSVWPRSLTGPQSLWRDLGVIAPAAILITSVVGIALWRAVIYASLTGTQAPSGVRAGIWLGSGMVVGQIFSARASTPNWIPDYPVVLLLLIPLGIAFTWWVAQCARILVERWNGRSVIPIMLPTLAGAGLAISVGLTWWVFWGTRYADESIFDSAASIQYFINDINGGAEYRYSDMLSVIAVMMPSWTSITALPLSWLAIVAILVIPLTAWTAGSYSGDRRWVARFSTQAVKIKKPAIELLPLRKILLISLLGVAAALIGILIVKGRIAPWAAGLGGEQQDLDFTIYWVWVVVTVAIGSLIAAIIATTLAGRYRLLVALIAAQCTAWISIVGNLLIYSTDGCHGPLNVFRSSCGVVPELATILFKLIMPQSLIIAVGTGFIGAALVSGVNKAVRLPVLRSTQTRPNPRTLGRRPIRTWSVAITCASMIGFAVIAEATQGHGADSDDSAPMADALTRTDSQGPSPLMHALQIAAWHQYGGAELFERIGAAQFAVAADSSAVDFDGLEESCGEEKSAAESAERYFAIPDEEAQASWREYLSLTISSAQTCITAAEAEDPQPFSDAAQMTTEAHWYLEASLRRMDEILETAGLEPIFLAEE